MLTNTENEETTLTLAGRIVPTKGHEEVIYAVNHLVKNGTSNIKVRFVGGEGDKSFTVRLKKMIKDLSLEKYIEFTGHRPDMQIVWNETDIALVCSKAEAFGRVTIEAMMAGTLVIGANTEGTAELINNKYGLMYKQGNYKSLAEKIKYAIDNKNEMIEIADQARNYAIKGFTAKQNANNIYYLYKKIVNNTL